MALPYVYRRPVDVRAPPAPWLLLRPDLNITATTASIALGALASTVVRGTQIVGGVAALSLTPQNALVDTSLGVLATVVPLSLAGQGASLGFLDSTTYPFRDVPAKVPFVQSGVFRRGFTVRSVRPPTVKPAQVTTGAISANRGDLLLTGQSASVSLDQPITLWVLQAAVQAALLRRQLVYRAPLDMRPWDSRIAQLTVSASSLTAYTRELTITGQQSTVLLSRNIAAQFAQLVLARPAAAARLGKQISAATAALTLTGQQARVGTGRTVSATVASLALTPLQSASRLGKSVAAGTQSLVISGLTASFGTNLNVAAKVAVMALTGQQATARVNEAVAAFTAALSLTANHATAQLSTGTTAAMFELTISGQQADTQVRRVINAAFAEISLSSQVALIEGTTAVVVQVGRRTVRVRARDNSTIQVH